jgi:hypothetical protein
MNVSNTSIKYDRDILIPPLFPLLDLLPCLLIEKIMDFHHGDDMLFRCFPSLPYEGIIELLG